MIFRAKLLHRKSSFLAYSIRFEGDLFMIISTVAAMAAGFVLGIILGTPKALSARHYLSVLVQRLAPSISAKYQDSEEGQRTAGTVFVTLLIIFTLVPVGIILILLYCFFPAGAIIVDALLCWSALDIKGINRQASAVTRAVRANNPPKATRLSSELCKEYFEDLDTENAVRAAVEGVSDRTVDSIIAPIFYSFLLSGAGALLWCGADEAAQYIDDNNDNLNTFLAPITKLRNGLAFIPGKLAGIIMLVDAFFLKLNTRTAEKTLQRDGKKCSRTYLGSCRAVLAGILGISLLPERIEDDDEEFTRTFTIGEHLKEPDSKDILLSAQLMLGTSVIVVLLLAMIKITIGVYV